MTGASCGRRRCSLDTRCYDARDTAEGDRRPAGRPDFKSGEVRETRLVGSTPTLFRHPFAQARLGRGFATLRGVMSHSENVNIGELVDRQKLGRLTLRVLILSFLAMAADGYDLLALGFAAPDIVKDWGVPRSTLGPVFSASLFGILFGAPLFGLIGDRLGRKTAIVLGCAIYGAATLAAVWATSLTQLAALRVVTGIGIGGLMPNTVALNAEFAPRRWRATLVIIMFTGVTLGGALPGWIAADLVPSYGWRALFVIGGVGPLVIGAVLFFFLPESIKFLALRQDRRNEVAKLARSMDPALAIGPQTRFSVDADEPQAQPAPRWRIFAGGLAVITPLLWLLFATNLMANFFLSSWMPILFQDAGMSASASALTLSLFQLGGMAGGLLISVLLDRFGVIPVVALFVLACPLVVLIGTPGLSQPLLLGVVCLAGFCILGLQFGINAISGIIYPTAIRAKGSGLAFAIGRFGSIAGPIFGGILIGMQLPLQKLFYAPAVSLAIGACAAVVMMRLCVRRFGGHRLEDREVVGAARDRCAIGLAVPAGNRSGP
jgi:MFS transporter, AAHS family, 4-hydroxybenzoate transporter